MGFDSLIHFYSWLPGTGENIIVYGRVGFVGLMVEMFWYGGVSWIITGVPCFGFSMLSLTALITMSLFTVVLKYTAVLTLSILYNTILIW